MKAHVRLLLFVFALAALILAAAPRVTKAATAVVCMADPSTAVLGTKITITCTGFDPNTIVNSYTVDPTGFAEIGDDDFSACVMNGQGGSGRSAKTNENGAVTFYWYTQNGVNTCPRVNYSGYANQIGPYTFVVHELDGAGGIKYKGTVRVNLNGRSASYSGAQLSAANVVVPGVVKLAGTGFAPNEAVSVWFTRPANCTGHGWEFWTGVSAFDPTRWGFLMNVDGPGTVLADASGNIAASYNFGVNGLAETPCVGTWSVTARALVSGMGSTANFLVSARSVANNAALSTLESSVPSTGQTYNRYGRYEWGVGVHVLGSGFPAGAKANCWFTRPDGSVARANPEGFANGVTFTADASGGFTGVVVSSSSEIGFQGEQLGRWAITCGTPDKQYSATAWFWVVGLLDP
ncbi:MAG TPA: hypothetical protein VIX58_10535 [Anaerolineae bacterium]